MAKSKKNAAPEEEMPQEREVNKTAPDADVAEAESPTAESAESEKTAELEAALASEKDKYLRLAAEYDNYRKRSAKEREALFTDVRADTVLKLLPVYDNLARALRQTCADEAFYKGVEMTMNQLKDILSSLGVTEIPALGEQFDPSRHNAVMHVEDPELGENVVADEFEKGFMLGEKVIRFSTVKVAN